MASTSFRLQSHQLLEELSKSVQHHSFRGAENPRLERLRRELGIERMRRIERRPFLFDYKTEQEKIELARVLLARRFTESTEVGSLYENALKSAFLHEDLPILYKPFRLPVSETYHNRKGVSFHTLHYLFGSHLMGGRGILVEPKEENFIDERYLKRLRAVREYGLYVVLVTQPKFRSTVISEPKAASNVDELWYVTGNALGAAKLANRVRALAIRADVRTHAAVEGLLDRLRS